MKTLKFDNIPEYNIVAFGEGVLATLDKLGFKYLCDETSPPYNGECTYEVLEVEPDPDFKEEEKPF